MVGEMAAATRQRAQAALQLEAVHAQATAWEQERRTRVNARRAELEALLGSVGTEITEITEITLKGAGVALKDDAGVAAPADADAALKSAREAVERASEALAQLREEASATLAQMQTRVRRSFTEAQAAAERVIEADAAAASSRARLDSAQQRAAALRASVSAWGWDARRLKAARALADAGEVSRQGILRDAAREAPTGVDIEADLARKGLVPLEQPFTLASMGSSPKWERPKRACMPRSPSSPRLTPPM
jgi:chromosome segregation ATPase